jgi:hypothetical protein
MLIVGHRFDGADQRLPYGREADKPSILRSNALMLRARKCSDAGWRGPDAKQGSTRQKVGKSAIEDKWER